MHEEMGHRSEIETENLPAGKLTKAIITAVTSLVC
jgi:hypothetical protein